MLPTAKNKPPAPLLYADRDHSDRPICIDCFPKVRNEINDPDEYDEWVRTQQFACADWENMPADKRREMDLECPLGWVKLLLDSRKWPRVKGRCWACCRQLALTYRRLLEEIRGAQKVKEFRTRCDAAAKETAAFALEVAGSDYEPRVPVLQPDPKYSYLLKLQASHLASLRVLLAEPESISVKPLWRVLHGRIVAVLRDGVIDDLQAENIKYEPLAVGSHKLWEIAVSLKRAATMGSVAERNFAGVVRAKAKDPYNLPERLALVVIYQEAQKMVPPMGDGELARVLIEYEVVDGKWCGDDVKELEANIHSAVKKYRPLMPLQTYLRQIP